MNEEDLKELLELLATDYGRGYLDGVVGGLSMLLKISKEADRIFGKYAGYAQQYLFYYGREEKIGK